MSEAIGPVSVLLGPGGDEGIFSASAPAQETQALVDSEVRRILESCFAEALDTLVRHRDRLDPLAERLLENETLDEAVAYLAAGLPSRDLRAIAYFTTLLPPRAAAAGRDSLTVIHRSSRRRWSGGLRLGGELRQWHAVAMTSLDPSRARVFGANAGAYEGARPGYPDAAVDWLLPRSATRVADVGAGTGKLTGALLARGVEVVAVEPDAGMLAVLTRLHPRQNRTSVARMRCPSHREVLMRCSLRRHGTRSPTSRQLPRYAACSALLVGSGWFGSWFGTWRNRESHGR